MASASQAKPNSARYEPLDSYLENVEQNDFKKIYRAKTPRTQRKIITYFSEPWRPLRETRFSDLFSIQKFQISLARF
jgi:hypothetical protein